MQLFSAFPGMFSFSAPRHKAFVVTQSHHYPIPLFRSVLPPSYSLPHRAYRIHSSHCCKYDIGHWLPWTEPSIYPRSPGAPWETLGYSYDELEGRNVPQEKGMYTWDPRSAIVHVEAVVDFGFGMTYVPINTYKIDPGVHDNAMKALEDETD